MPDGQAVTSSDGRFDGRRRVLVPARHLGAIMKLLNVYKLVEQPRPSVVEWRRLLAGMAVAPLVRLVVIQASGPTGRPPCCATCAAPIGLRSRPGALLPMARCAGCRQHTGAPPWTVEIALLAAVGLLVTVDLPVVDRIAVAWWLAAAIPLALVDAATHRLPDRLTLPAAAGTAVLLGLAALVHHDTGSWLRALAGGLGLALFFALTTVLLGQRGFGLGDAKLALGAGFLLGWLGRDAVFGGLCLAVTGAGLAGLFLLLIRRIRWTESLPFGPFLVLGTALVLLAPG